MNLDVLKIMRSRNGRGGGVQVFWRIPDRTGFSLMMASLSQSVCVVNIFGCLFVRGTNLWGVIFLGVGLLELQLDELNYKQ